MARGWARGLCTRRVAPTPRRFGSPLKLEHPSPIAFDQLAKPSRLVEARAMAVTTQAGKDWWERLGGLPQAELDAFAARGASADIVSKANGFLIMAPPAEISTMSATRTAIPQGRRR